MQFSVIYSFDVDRDQSVKEYAPKGKEWELTEHGIEDGRKHRKYAGVLSKPAFVLFCERLQLTYDCETMGMIGAPGFGPFGWAPAVSFRTNWDIGWVSVYVCPLPDGGPSDHPKTGQEWFGRYIDRGLKALAGLEKWGWWDHMRVA